MRNTLISFWGKLVHQYNTVLSKGSFRHCIEPITPLTIILSIIVSQTYTSLIKKLQTRPYHLLLLLAIIMFATSFCYYYQNVDIHLHDTYFVIATPFIFWAFTLFLLLFWVLYHLTFQFLLTTKLIWLHISSFIFFPLLMCVYGSPFIYESGMMYCEPATWDAFQRHLFIQAIIMIAFVGLQVLYLINLIGGVIKVVTKSSK